MDGEHGTGVLFLHAHSREGTLLRQQRGLRVVEVGVGKAAAAARTARALAEARPALVCTVGVCGVYPGRIAAGEVLLEVLDACVTGATVFGDEGAVDEEGFQDLAELELGSIGPFAADAECTAALARAFGIPAVRATTVSTCTGEDRLSATIAARSRGDIETMESAAIAVACADAGVPWVELRVVGNETGDRVRSNWHLGEAADRAQDLALQAWRDGLLLPGGAPA